MDNSTEIRNPAFTWCVVNWVSCYTLQSAGNPDFDAQEITGTRPIPHMAVNPIRSAGNGHRVLSPPLAPGNLTAPITVS